MKKVVFITVLAIFLGALALRLLQQDAGYVLIAAWGKTIEMRLGVLLLLLLVALFGWWWLRWLMHRTGHFFGAAWHKRDQRRTHKLNTFAHEGLLALLQGDSRRAQQQFVRCAKLPRHEPWQLLAAARCALTEQRLDDAATYLAQAQQERGVDPLTLQLLEADLAVAQHDWPLAQQVLNKAKAEAPQNLAVAERLRYVYEQNGDWPALEALVDDLARSKTLPVSELASLKEQVAFLRLGLFGQELERLPEAARAQQTQTIQRFWQGLDKSLQQSFRFTERYAQLLMLMHEDGKADALLRSALKRQWRAELVLLYGALQGNDAKQALAVAEHWQEQHPDDSALQLTLGRICLRNQLWGPAKTHFKRSLELNPAPDAYAELARLLAKLGENENSLALYRQGLLESTSAWHRA